MRFKPRSSARFRSNPLTVTQSSGRANTAPSQWCHDRARSQRYPTLSAQAQSDGGYSSVTGDSYSPAVLRMRQPLYAFGRINSSIAVANLHVAEQTDVINFISDQHEKREFADIILLCLVRDRNRVDQTHCQVWKEKGLRINSKVQFVTGRYKVE